LGRSSPAVAASGVGVAQAALDGVKEILEKDPFQTLDTEGVGRLVRMAVEEGRAARPKLKLGICGEHGGDPESIAKCERIGLDYVSCSPYRIPIARLAAAHAALAEAGSSRSLPARKVSGPDAKAKKATTKTTKTKSARQPRSRSRMMRKKR